MNFNNYCVIDIETTGLSFENDEITEITVLKIHKSKIVNSISFKVDSNINDILLSILDFISNDILIIHNARFTLGFILLALKNTNYILNNKVLDTYKLSLLLFPKYECHTLSYIAEQQHLDKLDYPSTNACCLLTYEIFEKMKKESHFQNSIIFEEIS